MVVVSIKKSFLEFQPEALAPDGGARSCSAPPRCISCAQVVGHMTPQEYHVTQVQALCVSKDDDKYPSNCGRDRQRRQRETKRQQSHGPDEQVEQNTVYDANFQSDKTQIPKYRSRDDGTANRHAAQAQTACGAKDCATLLSSCETAQPRKRRGRPTKAQRNKFHKFLDQVKHALLLDPNFQLDSIHIPRSFGKREGTLQKVASVCSRCRDT